MKVKVDPEFSALIPPLRAEERAQLEQSLVSDGCRDALVVWGDLLVDGHNRLDICQRHGIEFRTVPVEFDGREDAKDWIDANQLGRRNLTQEQFTLLIGRRYNRTKQQGKRTDLTSGKTDQKSTTAEQLGSQHGVSEKTVRNAGKLANEVEKDPELQQAINEGTPIKQIKKARRKAKQQQREAEAVASAPRNPTWTITDAQDVIQCQALITDPPYGILDLPWEPGNGGIEDVTRLWATRWNSCGADLLAIFYSQRYLWEGRDWLDESFLHYQFQQLLVWHYPNNKSPQSRMGFKQTWEPIFLYRRRGSDRKIGVGGSEWGDGLNDFDCHVAAVPQSNFNDADRKVHPAQKPVAVMRWLVNALTDPGDMVADPFAGSGTTGIAAVQLNRQFHGIENDPVMSETARTRIACYGK